MKYQHSSGGTEWRTTIFDSDLILDITIAGRTFVTQFPRNETDEKGYSRTPPPFKYHLAHISRGRFREIVIFRRYHVHAEHEVKRHSEPIGRDSDDVTVIKQLCRQSAERDEDITDEVAEIHIPERTRDERLIVSPRLYKGCRPSD